MPPIKSPVSYAAKLHRFHAAPQATRVQFGAPISQTWRGDGGDSAAKQAIAYRLALCWNILEGVPTGDLEAGYLLKLTDAVARGDLAEAQAIVARWTEAIDMTGGRPNDCVDCGAPRPDGDEQHDEEIEDDEQA